MTQKTKPLRHVSRESRGGATGFLFQLKANSIATNAVCEQKLQDILAPGSFSRSVYLLLQCTHVHTGTEGVTAEWCTSSRSAKNLESVSLTPLPHVSCMNLSVRVYTYIYTFMHMYIHIYIYVSNCSCVHTCNNAGHVAS